MRLSLHDFQAQGYRCAPQRIRVLSEQWACENLFCPKCGGSLRRLKNNTPVGDFACSVCLEEFELKSTASRTGTSIPDGAYGTMIRRMNARNNPSLFVLRYDKTALAVTDFFAVPRFYFTPALIAKRAPLAAKARRAGWIGCTIHLGGVPESGRITYIAKGAVLEREAVLESWARAAFVEEARTLHSRGWLIATLRCIERLGQGEFNLAELYSFEAELHGAFPGNRHVREKLRQQLQVLRDHGRIQFLGQGRYRCL